MPEKETNVGIAEIRTARDPEILSAHGLGSCVAVVLYDTVKKVGGVAHAMLPSSLNHYPSGNPGKFVDTAVASLLEALGREGVKPSSLAAKLVGGANMFAALSYQAVPIGMRNAAAAREALAAKGIPILGEDVGGMQGRTVLFSLRDGKVEVRKLNRPVVFI